MKKLICFILVSLIIISCIGINAFAESVDVFDNVSATLLRAGGGGDGGGGDGGGGDGGGGGGGGGGGSPTNPNTGRQPTLFESIIQYIMFLFFSFSASILFYVKLTKRSRKSKKLMKQMMESDNAWKFKNIADTVNDSFYAIQTSWSNMDMSPASKYMSDELYDNFQKKLNWMAYQNRKNVLKNISLLKALPVAVHDDADNSRDFVWFYIKGKMVDYTIDTNTQMKISGSTSSARFSEYWQFTRKENDWVLNKILQKDESDQIPFNE